jgi:hypothetical protein
MRQQRACRGLRAGGEFYCLFVQEGNVFIYSDLQYFFGVKPVFYA